MWEFIRPSSQAFCRTGAGQSPSLSNSQATGRISLAAKSCAISRSAFCSSVSVKSTTSAPSDHFRRVRRDTIDWSVNSYRVHAPAAGARNARSCPTVSRRAPGTHVRADRELAWASMLFDAGAQEPLREAAWRPAEVEAEIRAIAKDADEALRDGDWWPLHPLDDDGRTPDVIHGVYFG